jgi:hypothetical protein
MAERIRSKIGRTSAKPRLEKDGIGSGVSIPSGSKDRLAARRSWVLKGRPILARGTFPARTPTAPLATVRHAERNAVRNGERHHLALGGVQEGRVELYCTPEVSVQQTLDVRHEHGTTIVIWGAAVNAERDHSRLPLKAASCDQGQQRVPGVVLAMRGTEAEVRDDTI